jgi:hypothetical protein
VRESPIANTGIIRGFMAFEALTFVIAALIHLAVIAVSGFAHANAGTAESVIAAVLIVGLIATFVMPGNTRIVGLVAQALALIGTLAGLAFIAAGIGPQTIPDIVYHVGIVLVLIWGLVVTWQSRTTWRPVA